MIKRIKRYVWYKQNKVMGFFTKQFVKRSKVGFGLNITENREQKIIVSMTTYNKRYATIELTLKSLLLQTYKPDKIMIWLDEEKPENQITDVMKSYEKYGIEYRHMNSDLKPHGKYFYVMREYPDDIVITVDDDMIYSRDMIETLVKTHIIFPNAICARRVHRMFFSGDNLQKYNNWEYECRDIKVPSHLLFATGVGGVLYPPHLLPIDTFNIENIKKYCYTADDIWLKVMEVKNDVKVVWAPNKLVHPPITLKSQGSTLSASNVLEERNDVFLRILQEIYPEVFEKIRNI